MASKTLDISALNTIYEGAEQIDREAFAEMRSNVLLVAGEHYTKTSSNFLNNIRSSKQLSDNQKLRLTKNHQHRIVRYYTDTILSLCPGASISPRNPKELQDRKDAEQKDSVYQYAKDTLRLDEHYDEACYDFVGVGECASLLTWNYTKGRVVSYEQMVDEAGQPVVDPNTGEMVPDESKPVLSGEMEVRKIFAPNLLFEASSNDVRKSRCAIVRDMVDKAELKQKYEADPEKKKFLEEQEDDEYVVFEQSRSQYERTKDKIMTRLYLYRKCAEYPKGYFYLTTRSGILEQGELPDGIFPLIYAGFDYFQTKRRAAAILRVSRPYQAEINRASSHIAQHQITVGDDKIIYQSGTKLAAGSLLPGVRGLTYQGAKPEVLPGRSGDQYANYVLQQIEEMYQAVNMQELLSEKSEGQAVDPYAMLFRSAKHKRFFASYAKKFERYITDFVTTLLEMYRYYLPDDELIPMLGRAEMVNIGEFKSSNPLSHEIKVEPREDTAETQLGRQLTFQNIMQYASNQMDNKMIGKLIKNAPYGNWQDQFSDFTLPEDICDNIMLSLERGEAPKPPRPYDDHPYIIGKLTKRTTEADFDYLDPAIQQAYEQKIAAHEQAEAEKQKQIASLKNEMIPADGPMIACEMYVETDEVDSNGNPKAPKRARIPQRALVWLIETLEAQNGSMEQLEAMNEGAMAEIAQYMGQQQQMPPEAQGQPSQAELLQ